ncbi:unnamed protein product [Bursaphelenchus okinawaensis]|uniref:Uncharacterized protein n=1 Tax=Bursaphelenchus okinawaensis TaxID=465554 RepID=A0A811K5Z6_9BILA|nr:unnamed protein product [Bursaphelenchus okinawaensis]CAG9092171.1 unnamed protein product [Bursaphelenchus okinawaensis]
MLSLVILLASISLTEAFTTQSYGVEGKIHCDNRPASGVIVHLVDQDTFSADDIMADGETGSEGSFRLSGHTSELGTINPELHVYHRCGDPKSREKDCPAVYKIELPRQLVTKGEVPKNVYHVDTVNLRYDSKATRYCLD